MPKRKYTYDYCKKKVQKFNSLSELYKKDLYLYHAIQRNGWIDDLTSHFKKDAMGRRRRNSVTKEQIMNRMRQYTLRKVWAMDHPYDYNKCTIHGWLDDVRKHFEQFK